MLFTAANFTISTQMPGNADRDKMMPFNITLLHSTVKLTDLSTF